MNPQQKESFVLWSSGFFFVIKKHQKMFIQLLNIKTFARQKNEVSKFLSHFSLYPTVIFNIQLAEENSLQASFFF
jgi:hypothetical protein